MKIRSVPSNLAIDPHKSPSGLTPPMVTLEALLILYFYGLEGCRLLLSRNAEMGSIKVYIGCRL